MQICSRTSEFFSNFQLYCPRKKVSLNLRHFYEKKKKKTNKNVCFPMDLLEFRKGIRLSVKPYRFHCQTHMWVYCFEFFFVVFIFPALVPQLKLFKT